MFTVNHDAKILDIYAKARPGNGIELWWTNPADQDMKRFEVSYTPARALNWTSVYTKNSRVNFHQLKQRTKYLFKVIMQVQIE